MSPVDVLRRLADHALSPAVDSDAIGQDAIEQLSYSLLDLFGCFLAARRLGVNRGVERVVRELGGPADATLWGSRERLPAAQVALAAGTIAHHLELDGGWHGPPGVGVHPAVTILPTVVALADRIGASGREFIGAAAAGYDVLAVLANWLCAGVTAFKLHPPGVLGGFGATAAAGRLLGHDAARLTGALAWCGGVAPFCPFESFTAGANAKDLYGGWPAAIGALLAELPPPGELSFSLPRLLGRADIDPVESLAQLEQPALLGADFKPYPTCRSVQPALTALEDLLAKTLFDPTDVVRIAVETYPYAVELDRSADSARPIGARTSIQTCLALRLRHGPLGPEHFTRAILADPATQQMAESMSVSVGRFADRPVRGASLKLWLRDGRAIEQEVAASRWSDPQPATREELVEKFRRLAEPSLGPANTNELIERTLDIERLSSVGPLMDLLARTEDPDHDQVETDVADSSAKSNLGQRLAEVESMLAETLASRGGRPQGLLETLAATRSAVKGFGLPPATRERALALALTLAPIGGGPVPIGWSANLGELVARLAAHGFNGPPGVLDGERGLGHLLMPGDPSA